jgi:hypothetical protein
MSNNEEQDISITNNKQIEQDGQFYDSINDVPDLGSLVCVQHYPPSNRREYIGLIADVSKLPKYDNLGTNSSCVFLDTTAVYVYLKSNKTWYEV